MRMTRFATGLRRVPRLLATRGAVGLPVLSLVLAGFLAPSVCDAQTLQYEDPSTPGSNPPPILESGFVTRKNGTQGNWFVHTGLAGFCFPVCPDNGGRYVLAQTTDPIEVAPSGGSTFRLISFDGAEAHAGIPSQWAAEIQVTGFKLGGGTVVQSFALDFVTDGPGGAVDFESFVLNSSFSDLLRVEFKGINGVSAQHFSLDNIAVAPTASDVLQYEDPNTPGSNPPPILESGFVTRKNGTQGNWFVHTGLAGFCFPVCPDNGGRYVLAQTTDPIEVAPSGGSTFRLISFDGAEAHAGIPSQWAAEIQVTGFKLGGGTVVQSFALDFVTDGPGGAEDFQPFVLNSSFSDLLRVEFKGINGVSLQHFSLDNIAVAILPDGDGDGVHDAIDNCALVANAGQAASVQDGLVGLGCACLCGDVNNSCTVSAVDAQDIQLQIIPNLGGQAGCYDVGNPDEQGVCGTPQDKEPRSCDVNASGACSSVDAQVIQFSLASLAGTPIFPLGTGYDPTHCAQASPDPSP